MNSIDQQMACHQAGAAADYFTHDAVFDLEDWRPSNPGWGTPAQAGPNAFAGGYQFQISHSVSVSKEWGQFCNDPEACYNYYEVDADLGAGGYLG